MTVGIEPLLAFLAGGGHVQLAPSLRRIVLLCTTPDTRIYLEDFARSSTVFAASALPPVRCSSFLPRVGEADYDNINLLYAMLQRARSRKERVGR